MVVVTVPCMVCRDDVRRVSACIADLSGVVALEVDAVTRTVRVMGDVTAEAVRAAVVAGGFRVT